MVDDNKAKYELKSVRTVRGMEAKNIAKLQKDGWEFVSESQEPLLRAKLTFRRLKPKQPWYVWAAAAGGLLLIGIIIAVNVVLDGGGTPSEAITPTETAVPSEQPSEESSGSAEATPVESEPEKTLTIKNNEDFAALLAASASNGDIVEGFAAKYEGKVIEFDGNIAHMNNHGDYKTRYDILIAAGDYSKSTMTGPNFKFKDVNIVTDLRLTGSSIPDNIGAGQNLHIIARVEGYNPVQQLFFLEPISTEIR